MSYDNNKQLIVSKVVSDNPKAPPLRARIEIDGVKYKTGLWVWTRGDGTEVLDKSGNKMYKGTLEVDDYVPKEQAPVEQDDFDDDIPF